MSQWPNIEGTTYLCYLPCLHTGAKNSKTKFSKTKEHDKDHSHILKHLKHFTENDIWGCLGNKWVFVL
jgi:hypothetical protein